MPRSRHDPRRTAGDGRHPVGDLLVPRPAPILGRNPMNFTAVRAQADVRGLLPVRLAGRERPPRHLSAAAPVRHQVLGQTPPHTGPAGRASRSITPSAVPRARFLPPATRVRRQSGGTDAPASASAAVRPSARVSTAGSMGADVAQTIDRRRRRATSTPPKASTWARAARPATAKGGPADWAVGPPPVRGGRPPLRCGRSATPAPGVRRAA